jgi:hypothetical protein
MPDKVRISLFTALPLCREEGLAALLDGLEAVPAFRPTHWGENERALLPYDRAAVLAEVGAYPPGLRMPGIARREPVRYTGYFNADASPAQGVHLEVPGELGSEQLRDVFAFGTALADRLRPLYGLVHPVWLGQGQEYNVSGRIDVKEFKKFGPRSVCARTWLGPGLVGLIGRDLLDRSGALVTDTAWGGVQLELLPEAWNHGITALEEARSRVMAALSPAGVFGDYAVSRQYKPGPRWSGVPAPG